MVMRLGQAQSLRRQTLRSDDFFRAKVPLLFVFLTSDRVNGPKKASQTFVLTAKRVQPKWLKSEIRNSGGDMGHYLKQNKHPYDNLKWKLLECRLSRREIPFLTAKRRPTQKRPLSHFLSGWPKTKFKFGVCYLGPPVEVPLFCSLF